MSSAASGKKRERDGAVASASTVMIGQGLFGADDRP